MLWSGSPAGLSHLCAQQVPVLGSHMAPKHQVEPCTPLALAKEGLTLAAPQQQGKYQTLLMYRDPNQGPCLDVS